MSQVLLQENRKSTTDSEWSSSVDTPLASVQEKDVPKKWWQRSTQNKQVSQNQQKATDRDALRVGFIFGIIATINHFGFKLLTKNGDQWWKTTVAPLIPANMSWLNSIGWVVVGLLSVLSLVGIYTAVISLWEIIKKRSN